MNAIAIHQGSSAPEPTRRRDAGFTLIELMVAMTLFLVLGGIVLSAVVSMAKGLDGARVTSDISAEARVAMERIAREVRQATTLENPAAQSMTVRVDFNGSGSTDDGTSEDPEVITYAYAVADESISMTAKDKNGATQTQALLAGQVKDLTFTYTSSNWAKDSNNDGIVTQAEAGDDGIDQVRISLTVERDNTDETFSTNVTLRNRSQT